MNISEYIIARKNLENPDEEPGKNLSTDSLIHCDSRRLEAEDGWNANASSVKRKTVK